MCDGKDGKEKRMVDIPEDEFEDLEIVAVAPGEFKIPPERRATGFRVLYGDCPDKKKS